ncbi:hypothetical protein N0V84_006628 [Fusarium piperis]|uniref:Nitrogen regulatory protein areA GATA-like domain-containing protein n=1 Tax=Fusarium piperis TaxID=1435070 RepID=A0A9W9BPG2_9HYPO|nr:hypothetical protein N0V84_006628 [Fusarium piperis]
MNAPGYILVKEKAFLETNPRLKERGAPISDLLLSFGDFDCRDRRDKVYGMLGLSSDNVDVNYAKSVQHVYNDVIRRIVRQGQMDTISKAEYFGKRLATTLGIRLDDRQLIKTDSLFICPPRLLTWTDERPFWENDPARVLPRPYYNHVTNILALSMTTPQLRPLTSQRAILDSQDHPQDSQALAGHISLQAVVADQGSLLTGIGEPTEVFEPEFELSLEHGFAYAETPSPPSLHAFDLFALDDQPRCRDDSELPMAPGLAVDYLSHEWNEEEIGQSWRAVSSTNLYSQYRNNKGRLENAIWRAWTKCKNNLSTIPPEELNWLKDCDVTWLYGPLVSASRPREPHDTDPQTDRKSILKRRRDFGPGFSARGERRANHKARLHEDAVIIGYDGGLGYFEDDNNS